MKRSISRSILSPILGIWNPRFLLRLLCTLFPIVNERNLASQNEFRFLHKTRAYANFLASQRSSFFSINDDLPVVLTTVTFTTSLYNDLHRLFTRPSSSRQHLQLPDNLIVYVGGTRTLYLGKQVYY